MIERKVCVALAAAALVLTGISGCGAEGNGAASSAETANSAEARKVTETQTSESAEENNSSAASAAEGDEKTCVSASTEDTTKAASAEDNEERVVYSYHLKQSPQYNSSVSDKDGKLLATSTSYEIGLENWTDPDTGAAVDEEEYSGIQKALDIVNSDTKKESGSFADDNRKAAQEWRDTMSPDETDDTAHYEDQNTLSVEKADSRCLSILRTHYQYFGGAHGLTVTQGYTFDARTGEELSLSDVLSDTDDLASVLYTEVKKQAGKEQAAGISDDARSTVEKMVKAALSENSADKDTDTEETSDDYAADSAAGEGEKLTWYVSGDGVHFIFDTYDIGSYAAGAYSVVLTHEDYPDLIKSDYINCPDSYVTYVSMDTGAYVDGQELLITPTYDVNNDIGSITVAYGDKSVTFDDHAFSCDCAVLHTSEGDYLYINGHAENDWESLTVVDLGADTLTEQTFDAGFYNAILTDPDHMVLSARTHLMSTAGISRLFSAGDNGMPESDSKYWLITGMEDYPLTLKKDAELDVLDSLTMDSTSKETFKKGTEFTLFRTDNESIVDAKTKDGRYVRFTVDGSVYPQRIDGQYNLDDLFDGTFFAG